MKRISCSDSLGTFLYTPQAVKNNTQENCEFGRDISSTMLDGYEYDDMIEENGQIGEKKRRLKVEQVKALESIFELDNKLDPERKVKLAQELGLEPRQVSIWFQNRRARWKTKILEKDYKSLKASYDALKLDYQRLEKEKESYLLELKELKAKNGEEKSESNQSDNENVVLMGSKNRVVSEQSIHQSPIGIYSEAECSKNVNECQYLDQESVVRNLSYQEQIVMMEEESNFSSDDGCNIFSVDQAPTLFWYFHDQRNK